MQLIKRLTQTLSAGSISLTFTDSLINNNSIIEVYADSIDVYPTALSQSGTSVTVQFDEQQAAHSILLLINNIVSLSDPTLAALLDVDLSTLSEDDILTYDETAEKWVNARSIASENITYDNTDSGLVAENVQDAIDELAQSGGGGSLASLSDVNITLPAKGDFLEWDGTKWVNVASVTTINLFDSEKNIYIHAMRGNGTGMTMVIPLLRKPTTVTGENLQYYLGGWYNTSINSWDYLGNGLIIRFELIPTNMGVYAIKGTLNIVY